jgi:hypothetical protein
MVNPHSPKLCPHRMLSYAGILRFHTFNNRMLLYDEARALIVSTIDSLRTR